MEAMCRVGKEKIGYQNLPAECIRSGSGWMNRREEIDFDALPERYVLKTNHSWRTIVVVHGEEMIVVEDRQKTDRTVMKNALRNWLQHDLAFFQCEYHYHGIPKKIIAEVCLPHIKRGSEEYKFLCINGKVFCIHAMNLYSKDGRLYTFDEIYSPEWKRFGWKLDEDGMTADEPLPRPDTLDEMIRISEKLSAGFAVLRVDFYDVSGKLYLGELTFTPSAGYTRFTSLSYDIALGNMVQLPDTKYDPFHTK